MSRTPSDSAKADQFVLLVDWTNCSRFHLNCSGLRLIATKGWSLYAVGELSGLMYVYDTEQWVEWIRRIDTNLEDMFLYTDRYEPHPLFDDDAGTVLKLLTDVGLRTHKQLTLELFLRRLVGWQ